jgi:hypothetical protein
MTPLEIALIIVIVFIIMTIVALIQMRSLVYE